MPGHRSFLRVNYYPPREKAWTSGSDGSPLNCVEHFDSGIITLLYQDDVGGLEVQNPHNNEWIPVKVSRILSELSKLKILASSWITDRQYWTCF